MEIKDIAIVGFSGVFPEANSVSAFSENLRNGKCSIKEISKTRLFNTAISDEPHFRKSGYLEEITLFDYNFFNVALGEAEEMTPHQRLLLHEAYKTFENAGYRPKDLKGSNTSVYVANTLTNYFLLAQESSPTLIAGNTAAMMASRISRSFDLRGLAINVDTTCSSSLTAITLACKDIQLGESDLALVCGANIDAIPGLKDNKVVLGVEAKNESCNPFSANAEGTMMGEAVSCILLKSKQQAEADGDMIYGVIKGFALNQDGGQSSSIMAPSSDAQADVIKSALKKAGLLPNDITFIEAHGTGTKLGDPIEIAGIAEVFSPVLDKDEKVYVSAVKSNIGHTDGTAGIVGVIKVLLSFKYNTIFPSVNALPLSPFIDFEKARVKVVTDPVSWDEVQKTAKKRAGVSAFGLMGTNVHLILESSDKANATPLEHAQVSYTLCFSAKSKLSLIHYLDSFRSYLDATEDSLHDIAFTLNNYRALYQYRYWVTVKSKAHLAEVLAENTNETITNSAEYVQENIVVFDDAIVVKQEILEQITAYADYREQLVNDAQKSLFVQYFSYLSLLESGVYIKEMIGIGVGKLILQVLKKEISLEEALKVLGTGTQELPISKEELEIRAKKLADRYPDGLTIVEVGYQGALGKVFEQLGNTRLHYFLVGYAQPLYKNLSALFQLNFEIEPRVFSGNEQFTRVELPSYCFDNKRCWIRSTANPYNPIAGTSENTVLSEEAEQLSVLDQMIGLWSEILKTEMQEEDDFFEFGGHSLNGLQLINKINKRFSLDFTIDTLFDNGTPKEMAAAIEAERKEHITLPVKSVITESADVIEILAAQEFYEVSFAQKRLWLLAKMSDNTSSLNVPVIIQVEGKLDYLNLNKAYQTVITRHESLRTSFIFTEDKLKQKIHAFDESLNSIVYETKENWGTDALNNYLRDLIVLPFDLESSKLIRANLIKIEEDRHIIVIALHHLVCDGWSVTVFQKEFFSIYNTLCSHKEVTLEPLKIQYKEYAAWQLKESGKTAFQQSESFWLEQFKAPYPMLELQLQKNRPAMKTYNGHVDYFKIPQELVVSIKEVLKEEGITLAMFFGGMLNLFLSKLSGESDVVLGLPITSRSLTQLENQVGLYLNTIAIRSRFSEEISIKEFLKYVANNFKSAYKHQEYPFELLLEKLQLQKNLSHSPLFDIVFTVQNFLNIDLLDSLDNLTNDDLKFKHYELDNQSGAQFDLFFRFFDAENDLSYELEYNTDLFTKETVVKYHEFLVNIIQQCVQSSALKIKDISLTSANELKQIEATVNGFNDTQVAYPKDKTVVTLFEEQVKRTPDNPALKDDFKTYSYTALDKLSNQIAEHLLSVYGQEDKTPIAVLLGRSADMVAVLLGILKTGRSYIPLDPNFPKDRLEYIIDNSQSQTLIYEKQYRLSSSDAVTKLALEDLLEVIKEYEGVVSEIISPKDTAYIIYTSGSTGNPKGVEIGHQSLVNFLTSMQSGLKFSATDILFSVTTYSFDISILEFFTPLLSGAVLYVAQQQVLSDAHLVVEKIEEIQPTIIQATPSFYQMLFNADWKGNKNLKVLCGGDLLSESLADKLVQHSLEVWNMYGPTETTIWSSMKKIEVPGDASNIGSPIHNTQFHILDAFLNPLPIGFTGTIYIAGDGLAKGYYKNEALTKSKFITNPFQEGTLLYETGDVGKWNAKGEIEFLGRNDNQVKIRGYRIELGDIENAILQYSEALKEVVVGVKEVNSEKALVAYLVGTQEVDKTELRTFLQKKLPEYMIPGFYLTLEAFPLTPNGKINRKGLPDISEHDIVKREYIAPRNATEESLVVVWQEMLNVEKIGIVDDFFALGGHSLVMAQVINRIQKQLGQTVSFTAFFENPTVGGLSERLQNNAYQAIPKVPEAQSYPLTAAQSRLWILSQLPGGSLAYNMPAAVELKGVVDTDKFKQSFQVLIERHEILRTYFKTTREGEIQQYIVPFEETDFVITEKDFSVSDDQENTIAAYLKETNSIRFNLEQAPLVRASLIKADKERYVFFLSMHHIVGDGWSVQLLISEVVKIYNALMLDTAAGLPQLNIQYKDYAVWLNDALQQEKQQQSEQYWLKQFEGELPVLELPSFKTRPVIQTYNGDYRIQQFSASFLEKLKAFSKEQDVTLFMTLMAGINALLHRYTGLEDIIVGTPIAGRDHPDLENQMGLYLNTLAIRTRWKEKSSFLDLLSVQKETLLEAYDHQRYPFDELVEKLKLRRDTSRSALFDVLIVLQSQGQLNNSNKEGLANLEVSDYNFARKTSQFDMSFTFVEGAGLGLTIEYNTDIYDAYLIERMFEHFESLLSQFLENPQTLLTAVDFVSGSEKQQLLFDFNDTQTAYPSNQTTIDLFREQVKRTPNQKALKDDSKSYSYAELDHWSDQIAEHLITAYGKEDKTPIAVLLERSADMVVLLLSIWKTGRSYIPLDPNFPKDRLEYIIDNSQSKTLIYEKEYALKSSNEVTTVALETILETAKQYKGVVTEKAIASDTAYIIYTSGSTGNPKGVEIGHQSLVNFLTSMQKGLQFSTADTLFSVTTYSFDISILEFFTPLLSGSVLYVANQQVVADPRLIIEKIEEIQPTIIQATPSFYQMLFNADWKGSKKLKVLCGGDLLSEALAEKLIHHSLEVWNMYGPTETTIWSSMKQVLQPKDASNIGSPIQNTQFYILDQFFNPQPIGFTGAIYIAGDGLAKGYYKNESLTKTKFIHNPFNEGSLLYETGDVGKWNTKGEIEFSGRNDFQVKIRGYRIELGDIESTILHYSETLKQVIVEAKEVNAEKVLVAYIVSASVLDKAELRGFLQQKLPEYMIPGFYVQLEEMPLTANGKINRKALPGILENDLIRREYEAPGNEVEQKLATIWQDILNIEKVGITDNFFELGGTSLQIIKLHHRIDLLWPGVLSVPDLFEFNCIRDIAQYVYRNGEQVTLEAETEEMKFFEI
ncbi:non-ribosomal peptide synthetase [Flavobacterium poyangense]|uniref:non-ribosomal peptide synthetase n=1 Tax=Flavobacterium poyangense TaxID=2204302 RepID=UPI001423DE3D|nr:non-ribosomal peptide synthetase [Flavobacterium sp. JXAS1]